MSETRNGVKAKIHSDLGVIYSNEGIKRLKALKSKKTIGSIFRMISRETMENTIRKKC